MVNGWTGARTCAPAICCLKRLGLLPAGAAVPASQRKCGFHLAYWGRGVGEGRFFWVKEQRRERIGMESKDHEGAVRRGMSIRALISFLYPWYGFDFGSVRVVFDPFGPCARSQTACFAVRLDCIRSLGALEKKRSRCSDTAPPDWRIKSQDLTFTLTGVMKVHCFPFTVILWSSLLASREHLKALKV